MMAWKPCVDSMHAQAIVKPRAVSAVEINAIQHDRQRVSGGELARPSVQAPENEEQQPLDHGDGGAAENLAEHHRPPRRAPGTDCRNPSLRSSMIVIVAKIAVKSRIITSVPGKKWA